MDAKIQAEKEAEIQAKKANNIHNLNLSKYYAMYHRLDLLRAFSHKSTC